MEEGSYDEILKEAYVDYLSNFIGYDDVPSIFWVEDNSKNNQIFRDRWGIIIDDKNIDLSDRISMASKNINFNPLDFGIGDESHEFAQNVCDEYNIPRKISIIYYRGKTGKKYFK